KMHMKDNGTLVKGTSLELDIMLDPVTYHGFLDVGFTRGFASSQAFLDKFPPGTNMNEMGPKIIPADATEGLGFKKAASPAGLYEWMGFEARDLIFDLLDEAVVDTTLNVEMFVYDFNEGEILDRLKRLGGRLRIIMDDSKDHSP